MSTIRYLAEYVPGEILAPAGTATADAAAPSLAVDLTGPVGDATADAATPGPGIVVVAPAGLATADAGTPSLSPDILVTAPVGDATADAGAPSFSIVAVPVVPVGGHHGRRVRLGPQTWQADRKGDPVLILAHSIPARALPGFGWVTVEGPPENHQPAPPMPDIPLVPAHVEEEQAMRHILSLQ